MTNFCSFGFPTNQIDKGESQCQWKTLSYVLLGRLNAKNSNTPETSADGVLSQAYQIVK